MDKLAHRVRLPARIVQYIVEHAEASYPSECCGIVAMGGDGRSRVYPLRNVYDSLRAGEAEVRGLSSRSRYFADPNQVFQVLKEVESSGGRLVAIYHSHIDAEAYFSGEDKERALLEEEPAYPGVVYLVVSVWKGKLRQIKCYRWSGTEFTEVPLEEVE